MRAAIDLLTRICAMVGCVPWGQAASYLAVTPLYELALRKAVHLIKENYYE